MPRVLPMIALLVALASASAQQLKLDEQYDRDALKVASIANPPEKSAFSWGFYGITDPRAKITSKPLDKRGLEIVFDGAPGEYEVEVTMVAPTNDPDVPFSIQRHQARLTIVDRSKPPVPPTPPTPPVPPGPDGLAGLVVDELRAATFDKLAAREVATVFADVASKCRTKQYGHPQQAIDEVAKRNRDVLTRLGQLDLGSPVLNRIAEKVGARVGADASVDAVGGALEQVKVGLTYYADH